MPYSENSQLPEAVRNSLSEADQSSWRTVFNSALGGTCNGDDSCAAKVAWSQMKKNARYFEGWASVELVDRQGDVVEIGAFKKTLDFFMATGGTMQDQHSNRRVGSWINYEFKEKECSDGETRPGVYLEGVVFKGQRIYDDVWQKVQKGEYADLSIGADPLDQGKQCTAKTCWNTVKNMDLFEVSPVEVGANQEASIEYVNDLAKSDITFIGDTMAEEPKPIIEKAAEEVPVVVEKGAGEDIMALLQEIADRVSALENSGGEAEKAEPEPDEEEEDMEEKSVDVAEAVAKSLEDKLDKMLDKALTKRLDAKEPETPRPALNKNDLQKSEVEQLLADGSHVNGMGYKAITGKLDIADKEARPW